MRMAVLGAGALGQAVARVVRAAQAEVAVWARSEKVRAHLKSTLTDVDVADTIADAVKGAEMVALCVPASALPEVADAYGDVARPEHHVLHAVRGLCPEDDGVLPHRVIRNHTCVRKIAVLGGPLVAPDLGSGRPVAAVLATRFDETIAKVVRLTAKTPVRIHPSHDVVGVEVAGAVSNVSALAVGMADALGLSETDRGILLTRGLTEAARLGVAMGGEASTFAGLAGVGELIPRQIASTMRHHDVGRALAAGSTLTEALAQVTGEVEGVYTAAKLLPLAQRLGVEMPLTKVVYQVCAGEAEAGAALESVLQQALDLGRGMVWA